MADEIHHPHDIMVHTVLRNVTAVTSFLQTYLPQEVSQGLNWSTLRLVEGSFVDEELRESEADFLYELDRVSGEDTVWLYVLLEHQSTPNRWMRFRLLKYYCRIWDLNLAERPMPSELRPIVPLVFYQGERSWSYSNEFADLFAESVRDWPGIPRFSHRLIDQSGMRPEEVQGELKTQLMQLLLMAAYHPTVAWMEQVAELLDSLSSLPPSGGVNYMRIFVRYLLSTQEPTAVESFREVLQDYAPAVRDGAMTTYAQELFAEGRVEGRVEGRAEGRAEGRVEGEQKGTIKTQVEVIEGFLRVGVGWPVIERATGVNEAQFQALKQQVEDLHE